MLALPCGSHHHRFANSAVRVNSVSNHACPAMWITPSPFCTQCRACEQCVQPCLPCHVDHTITVLQTVPCVCTACPTMLALPCGSHHHRFANSAVRVNSVSGHVCLTLFLPSTKCLKFSLCAESVYVGVKHMMPTRVTRVIHTHPPATASSSFARHVE
jgi:hypothetical protein